MQRRDSILFLFLLIFPILFPAGTISQADVGIDISNSYIEEYNANVPKSIVELQQFRRTYSTPIRGPGGKSGVVTLMNLNPSINIWYLLRLNWNDGSPETVYHLENPYPKQQEFVLDESHPDRFVIVDGIHKVGCKIWDSTSRPPSTPANGARLIYAPLCGEKLYLRNPTKGHRTNIEVVTDFLRDKIPGGESMVTFVRDTFFKDTFRKEGRMIAGSTSKDVVESPEMPAPASMNPDYRGRRIVPTDLGIDIKNPSSKSVTPGSWYAVKDNPGIYVSLIQPNLISTEIFKGYSKLVKRLDRYEKSALVYLIAFDMDRFDLGFAIGTRHPRVKWSRRVQDTMRDSRLPGPDGIGVVAPLIVTGLINSINASRTAATFTGGFKRSHGAFKYGDLALKNHGTHYGFVESGVVFSKLHPGLSTLFVLADGTVDMKTWREGDNTKLRRISHARQNGVPIVDFDPVTKKSGPGRLVSRWGRGNWSGSKDKRLRTLRAGLAFQEKQGKRFLIYGYFSSATPSAMARVFQAYECRYAMHLDMNALEHTYLALYKREGANLFVQHLIRGMNVLDKTDHGQYVPRFLGYSDNRDFFYLMRRHP